VPLKQDNEPPYPISEIQMLHEADQSSELRRRALHIEIKRLLEPVQEDLGSN
jgi:hypothetical protein